MFQFLCGYTNLGDFRNKRELSFDSSLGNYANFSYQPELLCSLMIAQVSDAGLLLMIKLLF